MLWSMESSIHLVKKLDRKWRFTIDYQKLNGQTILDAFLLPNIDAMFDTLKGAKYFSKLDLTDGFWHIPLRDEDKMKTGFGTSEGLYQWRVLPQELMNSPATFQR